MVLATEKGQSNFPAQVSRQRFRLHRNMVRYRDSAGNFIPETEWHLSENATSYYVTDENGTQLLFRQRNNHQYQ